MTQSCAPSVHIRHAIRRDVDEIVRIANEWQRGHTAETLLQYLRQRNQIGVVAEWEGEIVGFMLYALEFRKTTLDSLFIDPAYLLRGFGRSLLLRLQSRLNPRRRRKIEAVVPDTNLPAHLFLRQCGYRATCVLRHHHDPREEKYLFLPGTRPVSDHYLFQFQV